VSVIVSVEIMVNEYESLNTNNNTRDLKLAEWECAEMKDEMKSAAHKRFYSGSTQPAYSTTLVPHQGF